MFTWSSSFFLDQDCLEIYNPIPDLIFRHYASLFMTICHTIPSKCSTTIYLRNYLTISYHYNMSTTSQACMLSLTFYIMSNTVDVYRDNDYNRNFNWYIEFTICTGLCMGTILVAFSPICSTPSLPFDNCEFFPHEMLARTLKKKITIVRDSWIPFSVLWCAPMRTWMTSTYCI